MGRVDSALRRAASEGGPALEERADRPDSADGPAPAGGAPPAALRSDSRVVLSHINPALAQKVVADDQIDPTSREQYRRLAAALHQGRASTSTGLTVVMVASAVAGEGKTLTAANLALTLSESYQQRVLLIDADLRRPSLHTVFKISRSPGLTDALTSVEDRPMVVQQISPFLAVLPAGKLRVDPIAGLTSGRMRQIVQTARASYDWVLIDTPPVGVLTDASLLSSMVDGTVLVVKADATPYDLVKRAVDAIGGERVLGIVLNRATLHAHRYSYGYGDYHRYLTPESADQSQ